MPYSSRIDSELWRHGEELYRLLYAHIGPGEEEEEEDAKALDPESLHGGCCGMT
jgi:hypothetical protein